jgi:radical SAM protein with 4Fe4S-binding SPASM domain
VKVQFYERDSQHLAVLPDISQWLIVDHEGRKVLQGIVDGKNADEIAADFPGGVRKEILKTHNELQQLLLRDQNQPEQFIEHTLTARSTVALIAVTSACNLRCPHCYVDAARKTTNELSLDEHRGLARQIRSELTPNPVVRYRINLTGGEPFVHPRMMEIIEVYNSVGLEISISTNALLIRDFQIPIFAEKGIIFQISLDGANATTHDQNRGGGNFEKTVATIKKLTANGIRVGINYLLHERNFDELEAAIQLAHDMGCSGFNPINLVQLGRATDKSSGLVRVSDRESFRRIARHFAEHSQHNRLFARNSMFSSIGSALLAGITCMSCGVGNRPCIYVDQVGNVYPCANTQFEEFRLGNIRQQTIAEITDRQHPVLTRLRDLCVDTLNSTCESCDVRRFCGGDCRGETYHTTRDMRSPYLACADRHDSIIELMWIVAENPQLFEEQAAEYLTRAAQATN